MQQIFLLLPYTSFYIVFSHKCQLVKICLLHEDFLKPLLALYFIWWLCYSDEKFWLVSRKPVKRYSSCSYTTNVWQFLLFEAHHVVHNYFLLDCGSSISNKCFLSLFFSCGVKLIHWIQCSIYLCENDSLKFDVSCP